MTDYSIDVSPRPVWTLDVETTGRDDVAALLPEFSANRNIKDPLKIALNIQEKRQAAIDLAAVNVHFARMVVLGLARGDGAVTTRVCRTEAEEREALGDFWMGWVKADKPRLLTFFGSKFDVPLLVTRARILDVPVPQLELGRYRHPDVVDVAQVLTFDWNLDAEKLSTYLKVYGIPHDDLSKGSDVPALVAAGDYERAAAHCAADVEATRALARRIGVA